MKACGCSVLKKMHLGQACSDGKVVENVPDAAKLEEEMLAAFAVKTGSIISMATAHSTFARVVRGGLVNAKGAKEDTAMLWEIATCDGSTHLRYGSCFRLRNKCSGKYLINEANSLKATVANSSSSAATKFTMYNLANMGDDSYVRDLETVAIKAQNGKWFSSAVNGALDATASAISSEQRVTLMKMDEAAKHPAGSC